MSSNSFVKMKKDEIQFNIGTNTKDSDSATMRHSINDGNVNTGIHFFKGEEVSPAIKFNLEATQGQFSIETNGDICANGMDINSTITNVSNTTNDLSSTYYNKQTFNKTFYGSNAGINVTTGSANNLFGRSAGCNITTGNFNTILGTNSGINITEGHANVLVGVSVAAEGDCSQISYNTFIGNNTGTNAINAHSNVVIGHLAGQDISNGIENVFIGALAGRSVDNGDLTGNVGVGSYSGFDSSGDDSIYIGRRSGLDAHGDSNVLIGAFAGNEIKGNTNVVIGALAGCNSADYDLDNSVLIGNQAGYGGALDVSNVFQLQNTSNTYLMTGDFTNSNIAIGLDRLPSSGFSLEVGGDISASNLAIASNVVTNAIEANRGEFNDEIQINDTNGTNTIITGSNIAYNGTNVNHLIVTDGSGNLGRTIDTFRAVSFTPASNNDTFTLEPYSVQTRITVNNTGNYTGVKIQYPFEGLAGKLDSAYIYYFDNGGGNQNVTVEMVDSNGDISSNYSFYPVVNGAIGSSESNIIIAKGNIVEFLAFTSPDNASDLTWLYIDRL